MDKWERNSYKGTISEDNGHRKWTGVGKLIGPRGPGREKKNDWNFKSELEEFKKKKKKHDKKEAQFCRAGEEPSGGFTAFESRQLHRGVERASELCDCSSVRLNQVLPNLELGSEASFAQRLCWGRQKRQKKKCMQRRERVTEKNKGKNRTLKHHKTKTRKF